VFLLSETLPRTHRINRARPRGFQPCVVALAQSDVQLAMILITLPQVFYPMSRSTGIAALGLMTVRRADRLGLWAMIVWACGLDALAHCRKPDLLSLIQSLVKLCERRVDRRRRLTHG
jgi:hypothetical protein